MPRKYSLLFSEMRKNILLKFICCNVLTFLKVLVSVWVECWVFFFYFIPLFFLLINVLFQVRFLATRMYKFRFALLHASSGLTKSFVPTPAYCPSLCLFSSNLIDFLRLHTPLGRQSQLVGRLLFVQRMCHICHNGGCRLYSNSMFQRSRCLILCQC